MAVTDPIADLLTRIRNALLRGHEKVEMPSSQMKERVVEVLKREGYIRDYTVLSEGTFPVLRVFLKYTGGQTAAITTLRRVSKPGRRIYVGSDKIPLVMNGLGVAILSTSRGILTDAQARQARVGGEVLCEVW